MKTTFLALAISAAVTVSGCSFLSTDTDSPQGAFPAYAARALGSEGTGDEKRVRGILDFYGDQEEVEMPAVAAAGEPFDVTITTYGGGCDSKGGAVVHENGGIATVEPYDFTLADEEIACPDLLQIMPRTVQVRFDEPGVAVVRVVGLRVDGEHRDGIEIVLEKSVVVK